MLSNYFFSALARFSPSNLTPILIEDRALFAGQVEPGAIAFAGVFFVFDSGGHEAEGEFHGGFLAEAASFPKG
jgi:hypothetical protein